MKSILLPLVLLLSVNSWSAPKDSTYRQGPFRNFNICINWAEFGPTNSLKSHQLQKLPYGINQYLNSSKSGMHFGFFGLNCYYKNKFGFGLVYNTYELNTDSHTYHDYLTNQYPNYFVPDFVRNYSYSVETVTVNFSYRKHFRYFFIEPKLRIGFNSYNSSGDHFRLKEKGSNQYIQYEIAEQKKGLKNSYHALFNVAHQFRRPESFPFNLEVGGTVDFFVAPIQSRFTVSETPYGGETSTTVYDVHPLNPALSFSILLNMYF